MNIKFFSSFVSSNKCFLKSRTCVLRISPYEKSKSCAESSYSLTVKNFSHGLDGVRMEDMGFRLG